MALAGLLLRGILLGNNCPLWNSQAADQIKRLYDLFLKVDATQVEVNPLGETPEGQGMTLFLILFLSVYVLGLFIWICRCLSSLFSSRALSFSLSRTSWECSWWDFRYIFEHIHH